MVKDANCRLLIRNEFCIALNYRLYIVIGNMTMLEDFNYISVIHYFVSD